MPRRTPRSLAGIVERFLDNACPDHHVRGSQDHVRARGTAMRLLARYPDIAHANLQTAVVCGDIAAVERMLRERPELASTRDAVPGSQRAGVGGSGDLVERDLGPKGWDPLLYLCFTRSPLAASSENAVAIARLLLDQGADPTSSFMAGDSHYTPLVGAIGEGEEDRPAHPRRDELVRLLLERGAEPYDMQVVYNIHFRGDVLWFLELIYERSVQLGRMADWQDPEWSMLNMGGYGCGARWHLDIAIKTGNAALAEWCLTHGASANAPPARDRRFPQHSLYAEAVRHGQLEIADLLVRHGAEATPVELSDKDAWISACLRLDREAADKLLASHPQYLQSPNALFEAAKHDRADVVAFLLDLGVSPDVANETKQRALHDAAYHNARRVAELLISSGAAIDPVESTYHATPLGFAVHAGHQPMIDLLARYSRDVWSLTDAGKLDRLRDVLQDEPQRAGVVEGGQTLLMVLPPGDESLAVAIARLLMQHGADPSVRNRSGMTAAERAERIGMYELAEVLESRTE